MSEGLVIVGDVLLDRDVEGRIERLCPDAPVPVVDQLASRSRPGGAGLAALLAVGTGTPVTLITALARDRAGGELARGLVGAGVELVDIGLEGDTPEKIRLLDMGVPLLRLDRGGGRIGTAPRVATIDAVIETARAVLVSDYGHGVAADAEVRRALAARPAGSPVVWDPHPRGLAPPAGTTVATPNLDEAARFLGREPATREDEIGRLALDLRAAWRVGAVCITRGGDGAMLALEGGEVFSYACEPSEGDPCGAGDSFAVEVAAALARGNGREEAILSAVASAREFVANGGAHAAATPEPATILDAGEQGLGSAPLSIEPALLLATAVRGRGGTVIAAGGCFDLLHAGHLQTLEAARAMGDCLVVLLNGDRSVRRLKGPDRPVVEELERAAVLKGLRSVDEVAIFDESTPIDALRLLRPDVWVKGGDHSMDELPEREAVASWGGRTAIVPHLEGRSTTNLIEKAGERG